MMKVVVKAFFAASAYLFVLTQTAPNDCKEWTNTVKNNIEANIVLAKIDRNGSVVTLYGKNPKTGKSTELNDGSGWIGQIVAKFKIGDTIVKKKGIYTTTIKRRDTVFNIPLECGGQFYYDK